MLEFQSVQQVASNPPTEIRCALAARYPSSLPLPETFPWRLLAEHASLMAHEAYIRHAFNEAHEWSALGIEVYERLAAQSAGEARNRHRYDAMRLRHNAMIYCGPRVGDRFTDVSEFERRFEAYVPMTRDEAAILQIPAEVGSDEELRAMELKKWLQLPRSLRARGIPAPDSLLGDWLGLEARLP